MSLLTLSFSLHVPTLAEWLHAVRKKKSKKENAVREGVHLGLDLSGTN